MSHDCWNDFTKSWIRNLPSSPTLDDLRETSRYYVISDAQLKRDLKPRTLADIYRENAAGRRYDARSIKKGGEAAAEYATWCQARGHVPHPASIDPEHPVAKQRESVRLVKRG